MGRDGERAWHIVTSRLHGRPYGHYEAYKRFQTYTTVIKAATGGNTWEKHLIWNKDAS